MSSKRGTESVKLSKTLSFILRHGADKVGIRLTAEGFAQVSALLALPQLRGYSEEDVRAVVAGNDKQRFALSSGEDGRLLIRANQGHSLAVAALELEPILDASAFPTVVHGTQSRHWDSINANGLSRMSRQHMHFAKGLPGEGLVISGMRASCDLLIYIDLEKALADGFTFFKSSNDVILSPGNSTGVLPPKYFAKVVKKQNGKDIVIA